MLETFINSPTFARIINSLPFEDAMDFLENFVVKNERIPDDMKTELLEKKSLLVYDFVGELMSLENIAILKEMHDRLEPEDFERIKSSTKAMEKIEELRAEVNKMSDSELQEDIEDLLEGLA